VKTDILLNSRSQGSALMHLRCSKISNCYFITNLLLSNNLTNLENLSTFHQVSGKKVDCLTRSVHGDILAKRSRSRSVVARDMTYGEQPLL